MPITGCAYYPEHWPRERWKQDAEIMRKAGLSVVRMGEFAWDKFEPQPGKYDFAWMDEAIDILSQEGLKIVMCTPTATPPPWLLTQHPEILRVEPNGVRVSAGGRRHSCANVPAYLRHSRRLVDTFTRHYGSHPAIIGWQIDNEFGCGETTRCYCDHCRQRFQEWLLEKYDTLDTLNAAWGTQFWGMTYSDWSEIPIPGITTEPQSPGMRLDYRRFSSDSWVRFQQMQVEFLRQNAPGRWITHNFMIRHWSLDYWKLAEDLDFVSYDNYPHGLRGPAETAMNLDLMRSLKRKPFWIMEQQPGRVNWHPYNPPVPPGQVKAWSHQNIAHGAEAVVYFRFRAARFGQEQYHDGLLKWDGSFDQGYFEAQEVADDIKNVPPLTRPQAKIGIIFDYEDLWTVELEPVHRDFSYWQLVYELYQHFWEASIPVDFLPRAADLTGYETVILPCGILQHEGEAEKWSAWVEKGGKLILTFRTAVREPGSIAVNEALPAGFTSLIGARVTGFHTAPPATYTDWPDHRPGTEVISPQGSSIAYKIWAETLETTSGESLFTYKDGMLAGKTAITHRRFGKGSVVYLGCWVTDFEPILGSFKKKPLQEYLLNGEDGSTWRITFDTADFSVQYEQVESGTS